ncbi:MAG: NAD-dependent epimerase/dehydratase family protein [Parachlamydiaceae bacterium]
MLAITGASGFIGHYVADRLPCQQRRLTRRMHMPSSSGCVWMRGDLQQHDCIPEFIANAKTLIHLACESNPRSALSDMSADIYTNLISTVRLFEAFARENSEGHIIFSSSGGNMYDDTPDRILRTEEDMPHPRSCYAAHKLAAENCLRLCCEQYGIRGTVLRISNPYGVFLPKQRTQGLIGVAFSKLFENEPLNVFDSLETVRDYVHLSDVAKAFNLVIQNPPDSGECRVFHVSSGVGHSISQVLSTIEEATQKSIIRNVSNSISRPSWSVLCPQKIERTLGWVPQVNFYDGIQQMGNEQTVRQNVH